MNELESEILRLKQENEKLTFQLKLTQADYEASELENEKLREKYNSLKEIPIYEQCKALEQENELKKIQNEELYADLAISNKKLSEYKKALKEIKRVIELAYKVEDYLLGQDYTDLVDRIDKELEVLGNESN